MNPHKLLIEIEAIEYFCDALQEQIDRQNNNALWYAQELNHLSHRAQRDMETFKEKADDALAEIRSKIESACDQLEELSQEEKDELLAAELRKSINTVKDEDIIAATIGDERRVA